MTAAASCLITSDPDFREPEKTAPFFLPDSATPAADTVFKISNLDNGLKFSALMQSEDGGEDLQAKLFLNYGSVTDSGRVYQLSIDGQAPSPGHWSDGPREVSASYFREFSSMQLGCNRFTLMVIHGNFDGRGCPEEDGDYATQTWIVQNCGDDPNCLEFGICPPLAENPSNKCPPRTVVSENAGGAP